MKKRLLKVSCMLMVFTFMINKVNAECTDTELNKLNEQANSIVYNVELSYENGVTDESSYAESYPSYIISFYNMNTDLKLVQKGGKYVSADNDILNGRISIRYRSLKYEEAPYEIYSNTSTCSGNLLRTLTVIIPQYNELANDSHCDEVPDYIYCSKTLYNGDKLTYEEFIAGITKYKDEISSSIMEEQEKKTIFGFIKNNWVYIVGAAVVATASIIIVNKVKKNNEINKRGIV